ncbi:TetR/AcrR family transcriptional regulator [Roseibium aggregatum]|uniref:TetR/AcrR family transcriptional regulator n=1 Tax=Roseibium aggregatum TaxID=187304 RepID=UPI001A8DB003|nr:TetR/AcrR family transcriptional regulator [Roseibium aggregatum]MBN8181759.1 TetR/AcrR family transcriptional regulator [Roseibium aggregatum]UES43628.1 TetR family transcriptional regulator [Roseibium aggregatum]
MIKLAETARERILTAANKLFYAEGIRAVSLDTIAEKAGVTKKTVYYHFKSKDDLIEAYLASRDQPNLNQFRKWFGEAEGDLPDKVEAIFRQIALSARHPKWKGCGFLRTAAELANMPGHPAMKVGAGHKKKFEAWMAEEFEAASVGGAPHLARHIVLLLDGAFSTILVHRDPAYAEAAGEAARALVASAMLNQAG